HVRASVSAARMVYTARRDADRLRARRVLRDVFLVLPARAGWRDLPGPVLYGVLRVPHTVSDRTQRPAWRPGRERPRRVAGTLDRRGRPGVHPATVRCLDRGGRGRGRRGDLAIGKHR